MSKKNGEIRTIRHTWVVFLIMLCICGLAMHVIAESLHHNTANQSMNVRSRLVKESLEDDHPMLILTSETWGNHNLTCEISLPGCSGSSLSWKPLLRPPIV